MAKKQLSMPVIIVIVLLTVALVGFYGYHTLAPPPPITNAQTGIPQWVKDWDKAHGKPVPNVPTNDKH